MKWIRMIPLCFILLEACVDPLAIPISNTDSKLVVDGMITQEPGPYSVKLYYSLIIDQNTQKIRYETNAQVWIIDDTGESEQLTETVTGTYKTSAGGMQGEIGRSYHLRIRTSKGKEYESAPQLLKDPGTLEDIYIDFEADAINGDKPGFPHDVFNLYGDAKGVSESNLFRWRWSGLFEARSYPELRDSLYPRAREPRPAPAECSGYIFVGGRGLVQIGPCTCCFCWSTEYSSASVISDNRFVSANTFKKVNLGRIEVTPMHFYNKYYTTVEQLSLSEEAYTFWRLISAQASASGSIFQPNAIRVRGNIVSITDPDEVVLGFFGVSGITRRSIFTYRDQVPYEVPAIGPIGEDCRKIFPNSVTTKPDFW